MSEQIIEYGKDGARFVKVEGWVSCNNRFFGNKNDSEHLARMDSCTHVRCDCGNIMKKHKTKCQECRAIDLKNRYEALEKREWDGKTMLYSKSEDVFFNDEGDLRDYCADQGCSPSDIMLVFCRLVEFHELTEDQWIDCLDEHVDTPRELTKAINEFNEKLKKIPAQLYEPSKIAAIVNLDFSE